MWSQMMQLKLSSFNWVQGVESNPKKKSSAQIPHFSGRVALLHKLEGATASFVPTFVHPCELAGMGGIIFSLWRRNWTSRGSSLQHTLLR